MYILGYSGLSTALEYRRNALFGLTEAEYNICQGMDAAAVLLKDGKVIAAAEEERFNGEKHTRKFPINAINYCLQKAKITLNDVDHIAHGFNYEPYKEFFQIESYSREFYKRVASPEVQINILQNLRMADDIEQKFCAVGHHDSHAASAFFPSSFEQALVVVNDGIGELHSISVYQGQDNKLTLLKSYDFLSSLGVFYGLVTQHLGFKMNCGEYKVMGLAPYGDPEPYRKLMQECIELKPNGGINVPAFLKEIDVLDRQAYRGLRKYLAQETFPVREFDTPMLQQHKNLAAALQERLNEAVLHLVSYWQQKTEANYLCMAGGVALNCTTNGEILKANLFKDIYVQPTSGDAGTALGSALFQHYQVLNNERVSLAPELPLYGPSLQDNIIEEVLKTFASQINIIKLSDAELYDEAADMITDGKIIAWVQGSMEFGPRALGNRSILADPKIPGMRDKINAIVKKRESFRPFAPSVKLSAATEYFDIPESLELPYMLFIVPVREQYRKVLPSITHINGTARIQTVDQNHTRYWQLLDAVEKRTGIPMLLNTSFNVKGQPMVCHSADAIKTFLSTALDGLFVGNYFITRKKG
jgi:carbamoyltransferase